MPYRRGGVVNSKTGMIVLGEDQPTPSDRAEELICANLRNNSLISEEGRRHHSPIINIAAATSLFSSSGQHYDETG